MAIYVRIFGTKLESENLYEAALLLFDKNR